MIAYASRTGTRKNLDVLRGHGWRLMVTPACPRTEGFPYALDNGAWSSYIQNKPWDQRKFVRMVDKLGDSADFIILPDIVAGGIQSLDFSLEWLRRLEEVKPRLLLAVQDGMNTEVIKPLLSKKVGIFVGGTTEFKLDTLPDWANLVREVGAYFHVGRVNTARRIRYCAGNGVDSIDGTSATRFSCTLPLLDNALRQGHLPWW